MAVVRFPPARGLLAAIVCLSASIPPLESADCNENCIDDAQETKFQDCNANGIPDDCDLTPAGADFDPDPAFFPGGIPVSLEAVDLDLDGFPDLVTGDSISSLWGAGITIRFNDRMGRLEAPWSRMVPGSAPGTLVHEDFDRDGDPDIAIASNVQDGCRPMSDRVSIIENLGRRAFAPAVAHEAGRNARDLQAADLDLDGDADLVEVDHRLPEEPFPTVTVLRNLGGGAFGSPESASGGFDAISIATTDLDGDGDLDLAAVHDGVIHVSLFTNSGNGTFEPSAAVEVGDNNESVLAEDLDGDGDSDLFVSRYANRPGAVLANLARGSEWRRGFLNGAGRACTADLDRDGFLDLVAVSGGNVQVFRNEGFLSFEAKDTVWLKHGAQIVASADMDADGDEDVIASSDAEDPRLFGGDRTNRIHVLRNHGGSLEGALFVEGDVALAALDLDADGDVDLATPIEILRNSGKGRFPRDDRLPHGEPGAGTSLAFGDLDGDADPDLVRASFLGVGLQGPRLQVYPNNGAALFSAGMELFSDAGSFFHRAAVSIGDIDGDRDPDIVALVVAFQLHPFINEGDGTFVAGETIPAGSDPLVLATGDLNGDGIADLMTGNRDVLGAANVTVFRSRGDGGFLIGRNYAVGSPPRWISLGDIDADGDLDAAAGGVDILENDGNAVFESRRAHDEEALSGVLADLDGDGDLDIAAGDRTLLLNEGKGQFESRGRPSQGYGVNLLGADLDGDRDIDLIDQGISVAWNLGGGSFEAPWKTDVPSNAHFTGVVDHDADGDLDVTAASGPFAGFVDAAAGGRFENVRWRLLVPEQSILSMAVIDLDREAGLDLVFITARLHGRGLWRFALFELRDGVDPGSREEVLDLGVSDAETVLDLDHGDLDGDGDLDVVVTEFKCGALACASTVFVLVNDGKGHLSAITIPGSARPMERLAPVDLDGDGDLDLVTDNVSVYRNLGGAVFEGPVLIEPGCCGLTAGDVDGDGDADLATGETLLRNAGDGRAFEVIRHRSTLGSDATLGDLDGDGFLDLVGSDFGETKVDILVNDRKGGLHASSWLSSATRVQFLEDMDADGRPDIVVQDPRGLAIYWNRVDGPIVRGEHTDLDSDGRIDSCQGAAFTRGDVTGDGPIDITDPIAILLHLFQGAPEPGCMEAADADDDSSIGMTDPIFLLVYLFQGGRPPPHPGPDDPCHHDIDEDVVGCIESPGCRR